MLGIPRVDAGVQGLWLFNGNSNDESPNSYNGTDTNVTYSIANGKFGQGAGMSQPSGSKITLGGTPNMECTGDFTHHYWVNPGTQPDPYCRPFINKTGYFMIVGDGGANDDGWVMEQSQTIGLGGSVDFNEWQWMCFVRIGSTGYVYKNGVLIASGSFTGTKFGAAGTATFCSQGAGRHFTGKLDSAYWSNARGWTASEVRRWYAWATGKLL